MRGWIVFAAVAALTFFAGEASASHKVVCYLGTWAVYRPDNGKYELSDIDTGLCTHFIYAFVGLSTEGDVKVLDTWNDLPGGKDGFRKFTALKASNPGARFMVAIGGWNEGSATYSAVMNSPALRTKFIANVVKFMKEYNFDGFDLDWEYPGQRGGNPYDKENYATLLKEMRPVFDKEGYELSAAVAAGVEGVDTSYDVPVLSQYLDFINVMAYDLHGPWEQVTGQNAPLYASSIDVSELQRTLNVKAAIEHWIKRGADPSKLVLGMGTYGHAFNLASPDNSGLGAPMSGPGQSGPYTRQAGMLGYNEICEQQKQGGWTVTWDEEQRVPIAVNYQQWVGYDNIRSITEKVQYAMSMNLAGGMIWSLETDDFKNICGGGKYPLLTTINVVFNNGTMPTTTEPASTTTDVTVTTTDDGETTTDDGETTTDDGETTTTVTTTTSTTAKPPPHDLCTEEGYVRDKEDCSKFYYCQLAGDRFNVYEYHCDHPLLYDDILQVCNYPDLVDCSSH